MDEERLAELDSNAERLQKEGNYIEALEAAEEALILRKNRFGIHSDEVQNTCKQLCELCNLLSMVYLQKDNFQMAYDLLKRSEMLAERNEQSKAVTFNNFACYYRRAGKVKTALIYLQRALEIESRIPDVDSPADTHLNMCAVLSQLNRHEKALEHSMQAIILLQEELISKTAEPSSAETSYEDRLAVLAIAHHNLGVEFEFLKRYTEALAAYKKASEFAMRHLAPGHSITENLSGVYDTAMKQMAGMQIRQAKAKRQKSAASGLSGYMGGMGRRVNTARTKKRNVASRGRPQVQQPGDFAVRNREFSPDDEYE